MATTYDPTASSPAAWILFDSKACITNNSESNDSTAGELTSNGNTIEVTLWPAHPPIPSRLSVHCPNMGPDEVFLEQPSILYSVDSFLLLRIAIGCQPRFFNIMPKMCDYFIYRAAGPTGPSLKLLKNPHPRFFHDDEVGLLPRGDHFTLAALSQTAYNEFNLHLFKSEDWDWSSKKMVVDSPRVPIPENSSGFFRHITNTVITLGGEGGTIGWVDLWRGILLYDVLHDKAEFRIVPLPGRLGNQEEGFDCCPKPYRGIAVIRDSLKLVELEVCGYRLPDKDPETRGPSFIVDDWSLTTYTNSKITNAREDWRITCTVQASNIRISEGMRSRLESYEILRKPQYIGAAGRNLQNLYPCQPVLSLNDEGIVYLITRVKFLHPEAWLLAVDMRNNEVHAVATIEYERSAAVSLTYHTSRISSYLSVTIPVTGGNLKCLRNQLQQADDGE